MTLYRARGAGPVGRVSRARASIQGHVAACPRPGTEIGQRSGPGPGERSLRHVYIVHPARCTSGSHRPTTP